MRSSKSVDGRGRPAPPSETPPDEPAPCDTAPRGRPPRPSVTESDLRVMARLECRPPLAGRDIADMLDVTEAKAWRITYQLRQRGIARTVAALKPRSGDVESITYLRGVWSDPAWPATIEAALLADSTVADAACVTGRFDYRVRAFHADTYGAHAWFRELLA